MKYLHTYNEGIREFLKPKTKEEIDQAIKQTIIEKFEECYEYGKATINIKHIGPYRWTIYTEPFYLFDDYYLYKDKLFHLYEIYQYDHQLVQTRKTIEEFKAELSKKDKDIQKAMKKLE